MLEDHPLLRGGLWVFDLDPAQQPELFVQRTKQFQRLFGEPYQDICGALLVKGAYGRWVDRGSGYSQIDLGSPVNDEPWRELFLGKKVDNGLHPTKLPLIKLLDDMARGITLETIMTAFVSNAATKKDWRYYLGSSQNSDRKVRHACADQRRSSQRAGPRCVLQPAGGNSRPQFRAAAIPGQQPQLGDGGYRAVEHGLSGANHECTAMK